MKTKEIKKTKFGRILKRMTALMPGGAWGVAASLLALAALGLTALWFDPAEPSLTERGAHWIFQRQAVYFGLGLAAVTLALMVGWGRVLKATPCVALGWLILFVLSLRHGLSLSFGVVQINTLMWSPLVAALTLAWAMEKFAASRNVKWLLGIGLCLGVVTISSMNAIKASHDEVEVMVRQRAESGCRKAMHEAHWFSSADTQKYLPGSYSENMPAACALRFGHWFNALSLLLWVAFACATGCCYRKVSSAGKKMFVAVIGSTILTMAAHGYGMCFGIFPFSLYGRVPLLSYGGVTVFACVAVGVLISLVREKPAPDQEFAP